jgi:hypothetical protein
MKNSFFLFFRWFFSNLLHQRALYSQRDKVKSSFLPLHDHTREIPQLGMRRKRCTIHFRFRYRCRTVGIIYQIFLTNVCNRARKSCRLLWFAKLFTFTHISLATLFRFLFLTTQRLLPQIAWLVSLYIYLFSLSLSLSHTHTHTHPPLYNTPHNTHTLVGWR